MIKLLIADDEPLVCVGLKSMLKWEDYGIELVGTARNGQQAFEMIERMRPQIVVTDIKMPLKTGLELAEECRARWGDIPLFIFLTIYEDFDMVKRALHVQAIDYLIKLELTPESLRDSIKKAVEALKRLERPPSTTTTQRTSMQALQEKFFLRLYNNLFEGEEQYRRQKEELGLEFNSASYTAAACEIEDAGRQMGTDKLLVLYESAVQMVREAIGRAYECHITQMDIRHFSIAIGLPVDGSMEGISQALKKAALIVDNYFSVKLRIAVGKIVSDPRALDESYRCARQLFFQASNSGMDFAVWAPDQPDEAGFGIAEMRGAIRKAFEELDYKAFHSALTQIIEKLSAKPDSWLESMDAASSILYMAISLLPDGEQTVMRIFENEPEGYRCLYKMNGPGPILNWLERLRDGCCELLANQRQNYKMRVVRDVQAYIRKNLGKKLSLNDIAAVFNFSPGYLSQLFSKYAEEGFIEFVTMARVDAAKEMLANTDAKVFEIAEKHGFGNALYFSKVFKKMTGYSPREYQAKVRRQQ
jgi:two-component system response regulator YesN